MATEKSVAGVKAAAPRPSSGEATRSRVAKYLGEVRAELRKTTWPTRQELINQTQVVLGLLVIIGVFIASWDFILGKIFNLVLQAMGVQPAP